jgi:hypothetical protein
MVRKQGEKERERERDRERERERRSKRTNRDKEAAHCSETSVNCYQTTSCKALNTHCREDFESIICNLLEE